MIQFVESQDQLPTALHPPQSLPMQNIPSHTVTPIPGFVLKTRLAEPTSDYPLNTKLFVNICHSPSIPAPPLCTKLEIQAALMREDTTAYRIPISLSRIRTDLDRSRKVCLVFDVCVNSTPYSMSIDDDQFRMFLVELAIEWIEVKANLVLSRDITFPKMVAKGNLVEHVIMRPRRPVIEEQFSEKLVLNPIEVVPEKKFIKAIPQYSLTMEPENDPNYLVLEIELPLLTTIAKSFLDVESKRLIFEDDLYALDIALPFDANIDEAGAQFDCSSGRLHVTLATQKTSI